MRQMESDKTTEKATLTTEMQQKQEKINVQEQEITNLQQKYSTVSNTLLLCIFIGVQNVIVCTKISWTT